MSKTAEEKTKGAGLNSSKQYTNLICSQFHNESNFGLELFISGLCGSVVVKAFCYKPQGREVRDPTGE
jgi:hypothetical protein